MDEIIVNSSRGQYSVLFDEGLCDRAGEILKERFHFSSVFVLTDSNVYPLYAERVLSSLRAAGFRCRAYVFPAGEKSKNAETLLHVLDEMAGFALTRADALLALGGGVTGDLGGLAAALYMRGIACVQMPTTLLSAVDSSVGGKTAVDTEKGKNLIGAFWPPVIVLQDTGILKALPAYLLSQGAAEMIKCGIIGDEALFERMRSGLWRTEPAECVKRCVRLKAEICERDEREQGERRLLNLGHTFGHAAEILSGYTLSHGEAVAMGLMIAWRAAGLCEKPLAEALTACGLKSECPYSAEQLFSACTGDKKRDGDKYRVILPEGIGRCYEKTVDAVGLTELIRRGLTPC